MVRLIYPENKINYPDFFTAFRNPEYFFNMGLFPSTSFGRSSPAISMVLKITKSTKLVNAPTRIKNLKISISTTR